MIIWNLSLNIFWEKQKLIKCLLWTSIILFWFMNYTCKNFLYFRYCFVKVIVLFCIQIYLIETAVERCNNQNTPCVMKCTPEFPVKSGMLVLEKPNALGISYVPNQKLSSLKHHHYHLQFQSLQCSTSSLYWLHVLSSNYHDIFMLNQLHQEKRRVSFTSTLAISSANI